MSLLNKLRAILRARRTTLIDPVFGEIVYFPRFSAWCVREMTLDGKLNEADEISIIAGASGPSEQHREAFKMFVNGYEEWIADVEQFLYEDYQKWCKILAEEWGWGDLTKVKGFPILETSRDALDHAHFLRIQVSEVNVYVYIGIGWEVEHNRGVFIESGKFADYEVS